MRTSEADGTPASSLSAEARLSCSLGEDVQDAGLSDMAGLSSATFDAFKLEQRNPGDRPSTPIVPGSRGRTEEQVRTWAAGMRDSSWDNFRYLKESQTHS